MIAFLQSWLLFPLVFGALALGCGLLVRRVTDGRVPATLLLPVGAAAIVVLSTAFTQLDATAEVATPAIVVAAVLGAVLGARTLARPAREWAWPALAAALPAGAVALPVVVTGEPGFTGYGRIVDIAWQFELAAWLNENGRAVPEVVDTALEEQMRSLLPIGYPGGGAAALGAMAPLAGTDLAWAYQPLLAGLAALLGLTLFALLRPLVANPALRALSAGIAAQPTILFSYVMAGGIKELAGAAMLALTTALLVHRRSSGRLKAVVPAAIAVAAAFAVFSLAILPWLAALLVLLAAFDLWTTRREGRAREAPTTEHRPSRSLGGVASQWALLGVLAIGLSAPSLYTSFKLVGVAVAGGPFDLGNLAAPVPPWAIGGVWLIGDHRFPLSTVGTTTLTHLLVLGVLMLAAGGLALAVRRRYVPVVALIAACAAAVGYALLRTGPWVELKAFSVSAPMVLALAFAGATALTARRSRWRFAGVALTSALVIAVLAGNALVYQEVTLAPSDRLAELERLGEKYAGKGPTLVPAHEEYADYFLYPAGAISLVTWPDTLTPRFGEGSRAEQAFIRDLDEFATDYLQSFRLLVVRRNPTGSRPPANWNLIERTRSYEVWRQTDPARDVVAHFPLEAAPQERDAAFCLRVRRALRRAGPGARMAYAPPPFVVQVTGGQENAPPQWEPVPPDYFAEGPGRLALDVTIPREDLWSVWLRGSFGREVRVLVNDVEVGSLRWQESYPGQYEYVGKVPLPAGRHRIQIVRSGGSLLPGTGNDVGQINHFKTTIGPIAFLPADPSRQPVEVVPPSKAMEVCRSEQGMDWVEIVRPSGIQAS